MARKTSTDLRHEADRKDAIDACKAAAKAFTKRNYADAMLYTERAKAFAESLNPPPSEGADGQD